MSYFAIIKDNVVSGVAVSDSAMNVGGIWIDITSLDLKPGKGWTYSDGVFIAPSAPTPQEQPKIITKVAMITRFTDEEFVAILTAAKTDVQIEAWYARFNSASQIDLSDPRTVSGMDLLVSKSLLTQERADKILTDPVQESER